MKQPTTRPVPLDGWERRSIYEGFLNCEFPYLALGADVALGPSVEYWKSRGISVYLACIYVFCRAANEIPAFRQRIRDGRPVEHDVIHADFTVPHGEESFAIRIAEYDASFARFAANCSGPATDFTEPGEAEHLDHFFYMSCLPWFRVTHAMQPIKKLGTDAIPRLIWGKWSDGKLPISLQVHHSLVDGLHVAKFIARAEGMFARPEETFGGSAQK